VADETEVDDENETSFTIVNKCKENQGMEIVEDMNEATMNIVFYGKLVFLEECITKPKYDGDEGGYGKTTITATGEGIEKMKETIKVVDVIVTVEEERK
jgi:hypothetical protein